MFRGAVFRGAVFRGAARNNRSGLGAGLGNHR
ncbi:hypothetical protein [Pseudarthrobacter sp. MM222]